MTGSARAAGPGAESVPASPPSIDPSFFVLPGEIREAALYEHAHEEPAPVARYEGGGYTLIEDFDCSSGKCLFALSKTLQRTAYTPAGESCLGSTTFISRSGVSTSWDDQVDYPIPFPDASGNGNGSQRLATNLQGHKNAGCDSVLEYHILYRDFTSSAFSGSAIRVHYYPAQFIVAKEGAGTEPPRVFLQIDYAESGPSLHVINSHAYNEWNSISMDIEPDNTVNQVLIAIGGPTTWDYPIYFDDLEVYDYVGPSTSCAYNPKSIHFGNTLFPGQSSQRTFDVINTATTGMLFINPTASACPAPNAFSLAGGQGVTYIPPGQSHKITISFRPPTHGEFECELDLGNPSCDPFLMTGGTRANCALSKESIAFGNVIVGAPAEERSFYLKNTGGSSLGYSGSEAITCAGFSYASTPPAQSIAPGDSIAFAVSFAPPDTGMFTCEVFVDQDCDPITLTGSGLPDLPCVFVPDTLRFGEVELGDTSNMNFTVENRSWGTTIGGTLTQSCQGVFQFLGDRSYSLTPGQSKDLTISYIPTFVRNDTCTIQTGNPTCPSLTLLGSGNQNAECSVFPDVYDFGLIFGSSPGILDVTIRNNGGRQLTGTVPASCGPFYAVGGPVSYILGFQESTVIRFEFRPVENGSFSCEYPLGLECDSLSLSGTGSICEVFDTELEYDDVLVGDTLTQSFTIRNYADHTLSIALPAGCGPFAIADEDRVFEIETGRGREISVSFAPDTLGFFSCGIATNPACDSVHFSGAGVGSPECEVTPSSLDFGMIPDGGITERTFTIRNTGTATLAANVPAICGVFTVTGAGAITLDPNQEATFAVVFGNIANPGSYSCQLDLGGSDGCGTLALAGIAEGPPLCVVSPAAIVFGSVDVDDTARVTLTITNGGGGVLDGTITSGCGPFVVEESDRSYTLGAGESRVFSVRFAPETGGSEICSLTLGSTCGAIDLSGLGNAICAVDIDSPSNGESLLEGDTTVIRWTSRFCEGDLRLELFAGNDVCETIGTAPLTDGAFTWNVAGCAGTSGDYRVRATTEDSFVYLSDPFAIIPGANLNLSAETIAFTFDPLDPEQALQSDLRITNDGSGPLVWSAVPNHLAIRLDITSGTIAPGNSFDLPVVVDPNEVEGSELTGEITLYTNDPALPMTTIAVSLAIRQYQTGDVDVDDDIDMIDLAILVEHVLAKTFLFPAIVELGIPDVNGDGFIDVSDIVRLARALLDGTSDRGGMTGETDADATDLVARRVGNTIEVLANGTAPGAAWFALRSAGENRSLAKQAALVLPGDGYDLFRAERDGATFVLLVPNGDEPGDVILRFESAAEEVNLAGVYVARNHGFWLVGGLDPFGLKGESGEVLFALGPGEPNPFRRQTTLWWSLPTADRLSIALYDIAGRRVRTLVAGPQSAGTGSIVWNGRNDAGKRVPAGTYFVRGESAGQTVTRKIVLFR